MRTLVARDLTKAETDDGSWRLLRGVEGSEAAGTWVTPSGHAFTERGLPDGPDALHAIILTPDQMRDLAEPETPWTATRRGRHRLEIPQGELVIEVEPGRARLGVEPAAWNACAAPTLLVVSLCWRLAEIERRLDGLSTWSRQRLRHTGSLFGHGRSGRDLDLRHRDIQELLLDLPCCEGPLDDPGGYFRSRADFRLGVGLTRRLGLDAWRARLDERAEIVEAAVDSLVDAHRHREGLRFAIALETLILLALLADIGIHLASTLFE